MINKNLSEEEIKSPLIKICNYEVTEIIKFICSTCYLPIVKNTKNIDEKPIEIFVMLERN